MDLAHLFTPENGIALLTLTALEIVLGIDNIVFISILTESLEEKRQPRARMVGLAAAMIMRILLLLAIGWIMGLTAPWFEFNILGWYQEISGRDLVLLVGGGFLIGKSTFEIHDKIEGDAEHGLSGKRKASFAMVIAQIMMLDIVFSLDSVITAVGMADEVAVMIAAVMIAVGIMMVFAGAVANFVGKHPTVKMLALSFLLMIGFTLMAEAFEVHVPKGYIYSAMAFSLFVEMLNLQAKKVRGPKASA